MVLEKNFLKYLLLRNSDEFGQTQKKFHEIVARPALNGLRKKEEDKKGLFGRWGGGSIDKGEGKEGRRRPFRGQNLLLEEGRKSLIELVQRRQGREERRGKKRFCIPLCRPSTRPTADSTRPTAMIRKGRKLP